MAAEEPPSVTNDFVLHPYEVARRAFAAGRLGALARRRMDDCPFPPDAAPQRNSWQDGYAIGLVERHYVEEGLISQD